MTKENWKRKKKAEVKEEFYRIAECMTNQGDIRVLIDLIPPKEQRNFIVGWHDNDDLDQ